MIRLLQPIELVRLLPGARSFFGEGNLCGDLNESHFIKTFAQHINSGAGFVLIDEAEGVIRGAISGICHPDPFTGDLTLVESLWYVMPDYRNGLTGVKLLRQFELEAARRGVKKILMIHLATPSSEKFAQFYERTGYRLLEQVFVKEAPACQH